MHPTIRPGARVTHPRWGGGVVTRLLDGGRVLFVTLDDGSPVVLSVRQFTVVAAAGSDADGDKTAPAATPGTRGASGPPGGSGGDEGGVIVAQGTPEQVAAEPRSLTGQYLQKMLA
jgi:hypothetical protein